MFFWLISAINLRIVLEGSQEMFLPRGAFYILRTRPGGGGDRDNIRIQKHAIMMAQLIAVMKVRQKTHKKIIPISLSLSTIYFYSWELQLHIDVDIDAWLGSRIVFS